jgi:hypothetical protein
MEAINGQPQADETAAVQRLRAFEAEGGDVHALLLHADVDPAMVSDVMAVVRARLDHDWANESATEIP